VRLISDIKNIAGSNMNMTQEPVIVECTIGPYPRPMPQGMSDTLPKVTVRFSNGEEKTLFDFYPDEISFSKTEFIGFYNLLIIKPELLDDRFV
jgi:hypothetical protein